MDHRGDQTGRKEKANENKTATMNTHPLTNKISLSHKTTIHAIHGFLVAAVRRLAQRGQD